MASFFPGKPTNHQIMNGRGFFPGKPAIHRLMNGGFFWQETPPIIKLWMSGGFLHKNHTFVSLTPTMLLKMLYKIRPVWTGCWPVQDCGLLLVRSLPVAVWSFGQCEYIRTSPNPGLCLQEQKTGRDWTFKHYPWLDVKSNIFYV